jgi:hypothetical protein
MVEANPKLTKIRDLMTSHGVQAYLVFHYDSHQVSLA